MFNSMLSHSIHWKLQQLTGGKRFICFIILIKSYFCWQSIGISLSLSLSTVTQSAFLSCLKTILLTRCFMHRKAENFQWTKLNWNVSHTTKMTLMDFQLTFCFLFCSVFSLHTTEISVETPVRILHCSQKGEDVYFEKCKRVCVCRSVWYLIWCNMCFNALRNAV